MCFRTSAPDIFCKCGSAVNHSPHLCRTHFSGSEVMQKTLKKLTAAPPTYIDISGAAAQTSGNPLAGVT